MRGRLGNASVEAGGGRGLSGARHASPLFVLLAEEEDDKGEEVGWAESLEELGRLGWTGKRQVSLLLCFIFLFVLFLFNSFATVLNLKIIQNNAKSSSEYFYFARWTFPKAHKIFQGYLKLYSNYMNIIQIQIANELNPKSQK